MVRLLTRLLIAMTLVICYQNCAPLKKGPSSLGPSTERVTGSTELVERVAYDPNIENVDGDPLLEINRMTAEMTLTRAGQVARTCTVDPIRRSNLETALENGSVCKPPPLPDGFAACMAIGVADIRLSFGDDSLLLRPLVCNNGLFLCDGRDAEFRALLIDLATNPPDGCQ